MDADMTSEIWTGLPDSEYVRIWDEFSERFDFTPSIREDAWPGFDPPAPFITFDLAGLTGGPERATAYDAINAEALRCFVTARPDVDRWLVLDWHHPAYWFDAQGASVSETHDWTVPVYPRGDYYSFLTPDLSCGTFGHPWEQTLCVFGAPLVDTLGRTLATWLPVKRRS